MKRFLHGRNLLYLGVGSARLVIATVLILVSVIGSSSAETTPSVPPRRQPRPENPPPSASEGYPARLSTEALFAASLRQLNELGKPKAKVTMIEFADLQCPSAAEYELDTLPSRSSRSTFDGQGQLVYFGIPILGANSRAGLRAVYAAGSRTSSGTLDLLYRSQAEELRLDHGRSPA